MLFLGENRCTLPEAAISPASFLLREPAIAATSTTRNHFLVIISSAPPDLPPLTDLLSVAVAAALLWTPPPRLDVSSSWLSPSTWAPAVKVYCFLGWLRALLRFYELLLSYFCILMKLFAPLFPLTKSPVISWLLVRWCGFIECCFCSI